MNPSRSAYVVEVIRLFLEDPDTPDRPTSADWDIAADLYDRGLPLTTVTFAFRLAYLRRRQREPSSSPLPPIRSLAYFRTVATNLLPEETEPIYVDYVFGSYQRQRSRDAVRASSDPRHLNPPATPASPNRA